MSDHIIRFNDGASVASPEQQRANAEAIVALFDRHFPWTSQKALRLKEPDQRGFFIGTERLQ